MYHYPLLSRPDFGFIRGPGPGFGNLLFPIGRALRESQIKNEVFVKPTILNLKIGPFLRQERDWRLYHNELKGRNVEDWLNFFRIKFYRKKTQFYYGQRNYFYDLEKSMFLIKNWLFTNSLEKPTYERHIISNVETDVRISTKYLVLIFFLNGFSIRKYPETDNMAVPINSANLSRLDNELCPIRANANIGKCHK